MSIELKIEVGADKISELEMERIIGDGLFCEAQRQGVTQMEMAHRTGLSQPQVSRLFNGYQGFRSGTLRKFIKALDLKLVLAIE